MAGDINSLASDDARQAWTESFRDALALYLGISKWRTQVSYVRGGSIQVGIELLDYADSGSKEPSAANSMAHLADRIVDASSIGDTVAIGAYQVMSTTLSIPLSYITRTQRARPTSF